MLQETLVRHNLGRTLVRHLGAQRARDIYADVALHLSNHDRVLDIGAGACDVTALFLRNGFHVTPLDVKNLSCVDELEPVLFDGARIPFDDDAYDTALLLNVLHHTADPDATLREARRVARRIVIHEDIYRSRLQRHATYLMDSITNLEFVGHPHTNRDDAGWKATFDRLAMTLVATHYKTFWGLFANATYVVERASST